MNAINNIQNHGTTPMEPGLVWCTSTGYRVECRGCSTSYVGRVSLGVSPQTWWEFQGLLRSSHRMFFSGGYWRCAKCVGDKR